MRKLPFIFLFLAILVVISNGQEVKKYSKEGITLDYAAGWELTDQVGADSQQISLSNKETDSQILVIALKKRAESKEPMSELKKQVVDPWLEKLIGQYKEAGINVARSQVFTEIGGQQAEGLKLKFLLDDQAGGAEGYWVLLDKRLVLLYFIRPDKMAEKATAGWDIIRKSLRIEAAKK